MAHPLSPLSDSGQNLRTPPTTSRSSYKTSTSVSTKQYILDRGSENLFDYRDDILPSSPFVADPDPTSRLQFSPRKQRSPQKPAPADQITMPLTEDALRDCNEYTTTRTINIREDTIRSDGLSDAGIDNMSISSGQKGFSGADDTCFSTFSAVPNVDMTSFARIGQSPTKPSPSRSESHREEVQTPRPSQPNTPGTARREYDGELQSASPTPRRKHQTPSDDTTNLILDFTEQISAFTQPSNRSPIRNPRSSPDKYRSHADLSRHPLQSPTKDGFQPATPSEARHLANLLDFDLPPAPTPRSVPTITPRELETLKSTFLSEISSLKASLSGKEAEIRSLKDAKDNAERRVGEALEQVGEAREAKESLLSEKAGWEARDRETQNVLRDVREQIRLGEKEREDLAAKEADLSQRLEEAEHRASSAESKLAGLQASAPPPADGAASTPGSNGPNKAIEVAVEKVARELHALYKAKHEAKVGALKKSYEARWEKRVRELQTRVDELAKENEDLKLGRDATMTHVTPQSLIQSDPSAQLLEEQRAAKERELEAEKAALAKREDELRTRLESLEREIDTIKAEKESLGSELEKSRRENSDLVTMVDELFLLESSAPPPAAPAQPHAEAQVAVSTENANRRGAAGVTKASGLRGPGFGMGESKIGMMKRSTSGNAGSGGGARSGIMSNIERMGRGRAAE